MARTPTPTGKPGKNLSSLGIVFRFALRYPGHLAGAALALIVAAAATSGIPYAFKLIIDKGFSTGGTVIDNTSVPSAR